MVDCILVTEQGFIFCFLPVKNIENADKQVKRKPEGKILVFEIQVGDRTVECKDILLAYGGECH